ncbi:hypothetical protein FK521_30570, partial [Klebsiella pneumoniae]|nr:hypothetical protein [Klebsiella pneumoniae]
MTMSLNGIGIHRIAPLLLQGSASPDARMLLALPVEIGELIAARPELAKSSDTVEWDEAQQRAGGEGGASGVAASRQP